MCGLAGWQLLPGIKAPSSMMASSAVLCQCASERGEDAWGVIGSHADATPGYRVVKGLGSITKAKFARRLGRLHTVALHTRYGTTGKNTLRNAHPFTIAKPDGGTIIGMHNGVVYNHWSLQRDNKRKAEVDSEQIFMHIAENKPLSDIEAYGAVVYVDSAEPDAFLMGRFNNGELNVARITKNGDKMGIMWSSTYRALSNAASLGGFKATYIQIDYGKLYRVSDGEVWTTDSLLDISKHDVAPTTSAAVTPYSTYNGDTTSTYKQGKWVTTDGVHRYSGNGYGTGTSWQPSTDKSTTACAECKNQLEDCICDDDSDMQPCDTCAEFGEDCYCANCYCGHCVRRYGGIEDESDRYADASLSDAYSEVIAEAEASMADASTASSSSLGLRDQETRRKYLLGQLSLPAPSDVPFDPFIGPLPVVSRSKPCETCGFQHTPGYCQSATVTV